VTKALQTQCRVCGVYTACWAAFRQWKSKVRSLLETHSFRQCEITTTATSIALCLKKVRTFQLFVSLSNLNQFSKFLDCWKAYEICDKTHTTLPTSPYPFSHENLCSLLLPGNKLGLVLTSVHHCLMNLCNVPYQICHILFKL